MKCPVDGTPLMVVERNDIELDYCPKCKGIWFDADELELLAETLDKSIEIPDIRTLPRYAVDEAPRKSPRTGKKMDKVNLGDDEHQIIIDRDPRGLGLWFDQGELGGVIRRYSGQHGTGQIVRFIGETFRF